MTEVVDQRIRNVLEAMRQLLGFSSAVLARLDTDRGGLVLSFAIGQRFEFFRVASEVLGFDPTGAVFPLWAEKSLFIRCYRNGRIVSTTDLSDLSRGALPQAALEPIFKMIGPRLYVCVPIPGASGAILAVVLLEREKMTPLTADERDQLLLYSERMGQLIEADRLGAPPVDSGHESPTTRWLSVYLLDRNLNTQWSAGSDTAARAIVAALGEEVKPGQYEVMLADGVALFVTVYMVDPGGEVTWLLLCENLAQRDRDVRELRDQLRLRLARVHDMVMSVDSELRITACNDAVRHVLGYEPAELIGRTIRSIFPGEKLKPMHEKLARSLLRRGHVDRQLRLQRRDGTVFPAEVSVLLLAEEGEEPSGALATVRDLSEKKRQAAERLGLQKRVLRSERLAALGEMAARIAHEVRNPLAAIGAAALSIEEDEEGGEHAQAQAAAIGDEVRRLDTILSDLLQFARPRPVTRSPIDLVRLIGETIEVARVYPQAKNVEFELTNKTESPCFVSGDVDSMRQVVMNVLRNAFEACVPSGKVTCRVLARDGKARVEIADNGKGLSKTTSRRAFEPFYSTKSRGTGLGLSISRQIVEEHGGELTLKSRRNGGATATLTIAMCDEPS